MSAVASISLIVFVCADTNGSGHDSKGILVTVFVYTQ